MFATTVIRPSLDDHVRALKNIPSFLTFEFAEWRSFIAIYVFAVIIRGVYCKSISFSPITLYQLFVLQNQLYWSSNNTYIIIRTLSSRFKLFKAITPLYVQYSHNNKSVIALSGVCSTSLA